MFTPACKIQTIQTPENRKQRFARGMWLVCRRVELTKRQTGKKSCKSPFLKSWFACPFADRCSSRADTNLFRPGPDAAPGCQLSSALQGLFWVVGRPACGPQVDGAHVWATDLAPSVLKEQCLTISR